MRQYSPFFETLHDETGPVGHLGRGTHYSVLRCVVWHSPLLEPLNEAEFHDLAVIWDEDHDRRIMVVIERLFFRGLLPAVVVVGERKGTFSALVDDEFANSVDARRYEEFQIAVNEVSTGQPDSWPASVGRFPEHDGIIHAPTEQVSLYLLNIDQLWTLGNKRSFAQSFDP